MSERWKSALGRLRRDPMAPPAVARAAGATGLILGAALVGAMIRLLPWVLDPAIAWSTLAPFAKSLLAVAFEAALMTGWPVGWALATQRLVERGEARVLASLGERPVRTISRLFPQALILGSVLALSSLVLGREAVAPGRVVNELLAEGRASCEPGTTHGIPFVSATWLCPPRTAGNETPRLVGRAPVGNVVFTAEEAKVSDDLRRIELAGARLALPGAPATNVRVRVGTLVLRGLAPWARASSLPPLLRAVVVTGSALVAGCAAAAALLRGRRRIGGVAAAAIGAAGPLAALATLRALELRVPETSPGGWLLLFLLVPVAAFLAVIGAVALVTALPERRGADSK
jgi:chorismate-pyruvate lyase